MPHGQYKATDILAALGGGMRRVGDGDSKHAFTNAYAVLAVTMVDLYSGDDDLFVMGYATLWEPRCGCLCIQCMCGSGGCPAAKTN